MAGTTQSPLAMLMLVTPYTILYLVNQLLLHGVLDRMHYIFFELIFVLAFRKVFGLPDLSERLFPAHVPVQSTETVRLKTSIANNTTTNSGTTIKKKVKVGRKSMSTTITRKPKEQPYADKLAAMEKKFMDYVENTEIWEKVHEETSPGLIEVYQYKARPMCYKIIAVMDNAVGVTFDLLTDIDQRLTWDPLCVEAKTIANVSPGVKIQYVRTKGMWPTTSRDTLVLGTIKKLREGTFFSVTSSVEHPLMPERTKEKFVRMETAVAGQIVGPEPGHPEKCRLVQILDADLKGWIPEKVIQLVSTKSIPQGIHKINRILLNLQPYSESKSLQRVLELKAAEEVQDDTNDEKAVGDSFSHELKVKHNSALMTAASKLPDHSVVHDNESLFDRGTVEKKQRNSFRAFWHGIKHSLAYGGAPSKTNKILVTAFVIAILGPALARFRRRR
ncbi:hypothetical protein BCR41DRAFT_361923 [Lobosporangium transversale]|uniref:START domain-containing protein n=1 Tax=Lobosporangium transversale TaxID=64571 RepID=A0A1Y2GAB0_9FUNG|nr:hypothetical protein BCR41DRAFT_361923 [Lobosporangium transversale]ORZ05342.1 hypothetical protein BCR41DRAFT_361923 [Lobosporangium transversale]|eukprot:XP_021877034.1 hypothetical protein BCR41DRAFT_361923 [Lobosporangium transversale]